MKLPHYKLDKGHEYILAQLIKMTLFFFSKKNDVNSDTLTKLLETTKEKREALTSINITSIFDSKSAYWKKKDEFLDQVQQLVDWGFIDKMDPYDQYSTTEYGITEFRDYLKQKEIREKAEEEMRLMGKEKLQLSVENLRLNNKNFRFTKGVTITLLVVAVLSLIVSIIALCI